LCPTTPGNFDYGWLGQHQRGLERATGIDTIPEAAEHADVDDGLDAPAVMQDRNVSADVDTACTQPSPVPTRSDVSSA